MDLEIRNLVKGLTEIYEGSPWLGNSVLSVLEGIDPATAFARPLPNRNTIAELVAHMIGWRRLLLRRLQGDDDFIVDQKETFKWELYSADPATAWTNLLGALQRNQKEILILLSKKQDAFLQEEVAKENFNYHYLINGIMQHDIYHIGQIAILKNKT